MPDDKLTPNSEAGEKDTSCYLGAGFLVGGGRFSLLHELGRGGMGVIWLAHDERLAAPVALKFLPHSVRSKPSALNDLRQETRKSRMLSHPNIIRIYDLYEAPDELPFISMEYVDGPSLWTSRERQPGGFFTWNYLKPVVKQLCHAFDYAHGEKVIHRDLKPANMLLDDRQRLRLSDFGIAAHDVRMIADKPGQFHTSGTPAYMSPQQIKGNAARVTDDIYALGATLYELLTGQPPFYENDIAYQVVHLPATPLADRVAELGVKNEVPSPVAAMIMACLSKDPEKRPQSARAVAAWIGMTDSPVAGTGKVVPVSFSGVQPADSPPTTKPDPFAEVVETIAVRERPNFSGLIVLGALASVGVVTILAWDRLVPNSARAVPAAAATNQAIASAPPAVQSNNVVATNFMAAPGPGAIGIDLGSVNNGKGITQMGGEDFGITTPAKVAGKDCRQFEPRRNARCYFQIAPAFKRPGPVSARVQVEYFAAAPGSMQLRYDGMSHVTPHYTNGGKTSFDATNAWRITNYQLNDAVFKNGEMGGADFCLVASCPELYVHNITVYFDQ